MERLTNNKSIIITKRGCCNKGHLIKCKKPFSIRGKREARRQVKCSCLSLCQWPDLTRKLKLESNKLPDSVISD